MNPVRPNPEFWQLMDALVASGGLVLDRPRHSRHPRNKEIVYPLDYGYVAGTRAPDGEDIDLWLGSEPSRALRGAIVTVDAEKRDAEIKLLIGCTDAEIETIYRFYNDYPNLKGLLIRREEGA